MSELISRLQKFVEDEERGGYGFWARDSGLCLSYVGR